MGRGRDLLWMAGGALVLLVLTFVAFRYHREQNAAEELARKAARIELVDRMRVGLASAAEAEKSAVLATTDEESVTFADHARAESAAVEQTRQDLAGLLADPARANEAALLEQFTRAFNELRRIDDDLLALAVKNTNLKAYDLAYGPAAAAVREMGDALHRLVAGIGDPDARARVVPLALGAEIAALRVETMLPPHIAEESDQKMDAMEAAMAKEGAEVARQLDALAGLPTLAGNTDLQAATAAWTRFRDLEVQILALSRENTNVRSLTLSLSRKRTVMVACQDALAALRQAIDAEPIAGVTYGRPAKPR